ncbi:MAG: hypothetical protein A2887_00360 [Alphaproteobacteria bacterium RIFCSPLOWO2_01_FULL_40_26]|nr:MAG: hypothetical protein A3D15_00730 [Alphaproteobacteria bacterium RIFCSPHIGHO2_02_FULL_40_34]OFW86642.1 MAG: hypothetical protein A2794_04125 [Alphaproteobacteria bacterium RIFCSPHIGHO2_01_FULL_40_8]OFW94642.1 MAG: hypothetical protein A2887_00360 [Alphaproteobacteria bacterium RIFCSPLOWO2_01_FULL_40_26]OFX10110.1 MAG: hypothetical protein A3H30_04820 [Alphaproteobacteria bacterium RIFCSPLOWO2_02_FULL_40_19]OFX11740.1 MAG: hypothetical protein A3G22_04410 [Alphaproteobacteria bacterium RI
MTNLILIAIGGALGSVARYLSSEAITKLNHSLTNFPWGTFFVNVAGSMFAGIIYYFIIKNFDNFDPRLKNFLLIGFLGGFTTFSSFSLDFFRLATAGQYPQAAIYAISSVVISIVALFFGFHLMKLICN